MNRSSLFVLTLVLVVGCGASESDPHQSAAGTAAANEVVVEKPVVAAATEEQIKKWTPAPFDQLELLGVYEWEKTSFTGQVAALPDGKHFLVVGSRVILWSLDKDKEPEHVFLELTSDDEDRDLLSLDVSPDGKWFAVGDSNGVLRIWNIADKSEIIKKELYSTGIPDLAISPDGKEIATITYDGEVTVWSADKLEEQKKFSPQTSGLQQIAYVAPQVLAVAGESTSTWNTSTGELVEKLADTRYAKGLARSPDGSKFTYGADDKLVFLDTKTGKPEAEIARGVSGREQVAFSPDGKYLATNSGGGLIIWNLAESRAVQVIESVGWPMVEASWLPETNLLVIASDIGVTRVWGTPEQGAKVGLKPLHEKLVNFDTPATPIQTHEVLDVQTFPRLPGSKISLSAGGYLTCDVPVGMDEAKTFYNHFLKQAGWSGPESLASNPGMLVYRKDGFRFTASFNDAGDGKTNININNAGNYDLTSTPKFDGAATESAYESADTVIYRTKADLLAIETDLLRTLNKAGWTPYTRLNTSHSEEEDRRDLDFLKNGVTLDVSVGKFPVSPESYTITYSLFPNNASVPVPPDAGYVEFDGSTDPKLIAISKMSFDELTKFYDTEMAKDGWIAPEHGQSEEGDSAWLSYLHGQSDVTIGLAKLENGKTLVSCGRSNGSLWEGSLPPQEEEVDEEEEVVGIEAADFPILNASKTAKFDPVEKTIEVQIDNSTLANAAEIYTKAIEALGWKHDGRGIRDEQYTFLTYEKGGADFSLRAHAKDGNALVNFGGDGLLWTKPLPGGKELVSFERWLRLNKMPPDLGLLDRYEEEMKAIGK